MDWTESFCFTFELFVETVPQFFHNASIWLTLVLAIQRYIYICQATQARNLCTIKRSRILVVIIIFFAIIHISPRLADREYSVEGRLCNHTFIMKRLLLISSCL